jgi:DNA-binding XRE family transcriptional regulator
MAFVALSDLFTPDGINLKAARQELGLSQAELARLVGFSIRAIQSCEQGWRKPGSALEHSVLLLLMAHRNAEGITHLRCWEVMDCPPERREQCITYRSGQGHLCWFLTGTLCTDERSGNWETKRPVCLQCPLFQMLITPTES